MKTTGIGQEEKHDYDDERSATIRNQSVTIKTQTRPPTIAGGRLAITRTCARFYRKTLKNSPVCEATEANINDLQGHLTNVGTTSYVCVCNLEKRPTTTTMNTATSAYVYDAFHHHLVMTVNRAVVQTLAVVVHVGGSAHAKCFQGKHLCSVAELTGSVGGECYVDELLATQTSAGTSDISGYTLCANEGQAFALPSTCDVAYGANGAFAFRAAQSGTITFNNATFGDPAPGAAKKGYYRLSGGQRFYAHANHLYSVAAITNGAGSVVERYRYDTYGQRTTLAPDGITTRAVSSYNQQVGFTGRYLDKETGLWYFRARYYSGSLGRFVNRDPWVKNPWHADINRQKRVTEYASALNERLVIAELSKNGKEIGHIFKLKNELAAGIIPEVIAKGTGSPTSLDGYKDGFNLYGAYYAPNGTDPTGERGYWGCVCLGLKCELYTAACIAAAPLAFAACAGVCTGTLGLGCIGCVIAGAAGTVAACEAAYDCLSTYYDECL